MKHMKHMKQMKSLAGIVVLVFAASFFFFSSEKTFAADPCQGLVTDKLNHPMTALAKPGLLQAATDPQFGTTIRRISNAGTNHVIKPMYSTIPAWNADESLLILYHTAGAPYAGQHVLYDGKTYQLIRALNDTAVDLEQIHWDPIDPKIFYYPSNYNNLARFIRYHIDTDTEEVIHNFALAPTSCPNNGSLSYGSDPQYMSWDAGHRVVGLQCGSKKFAYNIDTDTVLGVKTISSVNAPVVAPSGNLMFLDGKVYDTATFTFQRTLPMAVVDEHASIGRKADGTDVYNTIDFDGAQPGNLVSWNMVTGAETIAIGEANGYPYPVNGTHISSIATKNPGFVSVDMIGSGAGATLLDNEIVIADLNTGRVCRAAHHHSADGPQGYWAEPHGAISPTGTRVAFASDWGGTNTVDTFVLELPAYSASQNPDTTSPTSPTTLAASATNQSSITVTWTAATDPTTEGQATSGITGYLIERCTGLSCSNFTQVGSVSASPFTDSGLSASTSYSYHVRAVDAAGNMSGWSNVVGATTQVSTPAPAFTLTASPTSIASGASSTLTWSAATNATSCTASGGAFTGSKATSGGTQSVSPTNTTTYTLSCTGTGGTTNQNVTVTVTSGGGGGSAPTLFFTDLESGPKTGGENNNGAFVTLYGNNFGTSPTVTVGGGQSLIKLAPSSYLWYQKMTIQLGANATTGNIIVTNSNGSSNGLPFTVRSGTIRFIGGSSGDYATILACRTAMSAGDICYVRSGYGATGTENYTASVVLGSPGISSNPMALLAYPGASVTIGTSARARGLYFCATYSSCSDGSYWVLGGFNLTGIEAISAIEVSNLRIVGNNITCPAGTGYAGCVEIENTSNTKFLGNHLHDNAVAPGNKYYHHMYYSDDSNNAEVGWSDIGVGYANRCVQFYSGVGISYGLNVHDNYIHDCVGDGINFQTVNAGSGIVQAYNNLIVRAGTGPLHPEGSSNYACIFASGDDNGMVEVFNNTFYDCGSFTSYGNGFLNPEVHVRLRNNIIYQLPGEDYIEQNTSLISGSNNVWYGLGNGPSQTTGNLNVDPQFVSLSSNFQLSASSPAINAGINTGTSFDILGTTRPQGSAYDLGAYEYGASTPSSPVSCNTVTTSNFSQSAYNSYGAPFDAFATNTMLVNAQCTASDPHTIQLTSGITGDTTRIVYTKGYYYAGSDWTQYTGTCTGAQNGDWCQGSVSATITNPNLSTASASTPAYFVGMTCSVQGGSWRCGCRDTACNNFYWMIQGAGQ